MIYIDHDTECKADALVKQGIPDRVVALELGINRATVARIRKQGGPRPPEAAKPPAEIAYSRVKAYWCEGCNATVCLQPCPACKARGR